MEKYRRQGSGETATLADEEQEHGETLRQMSGAQPTPPRSLIVERERWHRLAGRRTLRAAVFGMNDGLVSNVSLVLGVAAAGAEHKALLLTGLAGLFAGALSMAVGEYVSVASQRDVLAGRSPWNGGSWPRPPKKKRRSCHAAGPEGVVSRSGHRDRPPRFMQDPESALDTLVREELGLDPADLGAPVRAALSRFLTFAVGAWVAPVAPAGAGRTARRPSPPRPWRPGAGHRRRAAGLHLGHRARCDPRRAWWGWPGWRPASPTRWACCSGPPSADCSPRRTRPGAAAPARAG